MDIVSSAHMLIYTRHRDLIARGLADDTTRALLDESVRIAVERAPAVFLSAREVALDHAAQRLLDPASDAVSGIERAIMQAEQALDDLLRRQRQIADELTARGERKRKR